ncbi:myxosortase MrtX [Vulgatibacter sp.]|uniref:myxosortase MrtX n=1 Tax=Vulgatibacter sp. TaxID=1971226 RepID=UPI003568E1B1
MHEREASVQPPTEQQSSRAILREALVLWAISFGGLVGTRVIGFAIPWVGAQVKAVAAALFLYLPGHAIRKRGELLDDYAVPDWPWTSSSAAAQFKRDAIWGLGVSLLLFPPFILAFFGFLELLPHLPRELAQALTPYRGPGAEIAFRLPERFWLHVLDQFLVVALPEEFFYRGYLQTRLGHAWGEGKRKLLGVPVGPAFWMTQVLFAVGHLGQLHFWRLAVFFPSILFGWLRARTGSIVPGIIVHAISNLVLMTLEASAFGR